MILNVRIYFFYPFFKDRLYFQVFHVFVFWC